MTEWFHLEATRGHVIGADLDVPSVNKYYCR